MMRSPRPALWLLHLAGGLALALVLSLSRAADDTVVTAVDGKFDDVKESVKLAIEAQGLVINSVSNVAKMLERTAADLGKARRIYVQGEVFEFCSARVSRQMMEAAAANLAFCPFTIAVYAVPEQPETVFVAYRKPPADPVFVPVEALLKGIVAEAVR